MSQKHVDADAEMVRGVFEDLLELNVSTLTPSPEYKSPDLIIEFEDTRILTEVERKADDKQFRDIVNAEKGTTLQYSNARVEERVKHAWRQIRDYPNRKSSDSTLIWLIAGQRDVTVLTAKAAIEQLYGIEVLEGRTENNNYYSKRCYFFYESQYFKYKELDAVVVHSGEEISLCLNPYSTRYSTWKTYPFLSAFSTIIDPVVEESMGTAFFANCEIDRRDPKGVVEYLCQKYKLHPPTINKFTLINMPVD